jgi:hypothetical protein
MPHYFLELKNEWTLVRETPSSQKLKVKTEDGRKLEVDIHYTMSRVLTVNIVYVSKKDDVSKSWLKPVMDEIATIALKKGDYAVIDYTMAVAPSVTDGNFAVDKKWRKIMNDM